MLLGVTRQFVGLWFDSCNHNKPWHLNNAQQQQVDQHLVSQKVPFEIARTPRSLFQRKFWKASEWKNFLLYFLPVLLKNVLPVSFYNHWMLLVLSIHILLADKVKVNSDLLGVVDVSLIKFVYLTRELYGVEYVSFNVHQLCHIAFSAKQWGPLWASSAFLFENNNGQLLRMF